MGEFVPCLVPPRLPAEEGPLNPSSVLLDDRAYISAAAVGNATTAVGTMSTGSPVEVSFCLAHAPRLSYLCVHFPGAASGPGVGTVFGPAVGTAAVECVGKFPRVISTHAELALIHVLVPGADDLDDYNLMVYKARPKPSLDLLPNPPSRFGDNQVAILRRPGSAGYAIASLANTPNTEEYRLQLYRSDAGRWSTTLLRVDAPERDKVFPIPDTATKVIFHNTSKAITLHGSTVGWADLWRGILFCDVLDEKPVLRDMPLPKPARSNRRHFRIGCPHVYRDIAVSGEGGDVKVRYIEMETRPGDVPSSSPLPVDHDSGSESSDSDDECVNCYWKATIWTMPVPLSSWKDWCRDCSVDVTDIIINNPRHSELLLPLPRHSADPKDATSSFRRLLTAYPVLGLGMDSDIIYFLSKLDVMDDRGWVVSVNMRDKMLKGIAELDVTKHPYFRRYFLPSEISQYLFRATGEAGNLVPRS